MRQKQAILTRTSKIIKIKRRITMGKDMISQASTNLLSELLRETKLEGRQLSATLLGPGLISLAKTALELRVVENF